MNIKKLLEDDLTLDAVNAIRRTFDRVFIYISFSIVIFMQIKLAGSVLSDAEVAGVANFITLFGRTYSLYDGLAFLLVSWALVPIVSFNFRLAFIYLRDRRGIMEATSP